MSIKSFYEKNKLTDDVERVTVKSDHEGVNVVQLTAAAIAKQQVFSILGRPGEC